MNRRPIRLTALVLWPAVALSCLILTACGSGSAAQATPVVNTPDAAMTPIPLPASQISCRPAPESGPARSHLVYSGPCSFTETAAVRCQHKPKDFYVTIHHNLLGGATFYSTINLEEFKKPGTYVQKAAVYIEVLKGLKTYSWGQFKATVTVAPDQRSLTLAPTRVPAYAGSHTRGVEVIGGKAVCLRSSH